jgi:hypothetical protein
MLHAAGDFLGVLGGVVARFGKVLLYVCMYVSNPQ